MEMITPVYMANYKDRIKHNYVEVTSIVSST